MSYTKYYVLLLLVTLVTFSSCDKITRDLGKATSSGENTMGFYVGGQAVKIKGAYERGGIFGESKGVKAGIVSNKTIYIYGVSASLQYSLIFNIPLDSLNLDGEYILQRSSHGIDEANLNDNSQSLGGAHYFTTDEHDGMIKFSRYDDNVISGTFHFDAINKETGKVISVTEGRFDIKRK